MVRSRRTFTREFKIEAVRMVEEGERPVKEVAEQLGIHPQLLYRWRKALIIEQEDAFPGQGNVISSEEELRRLRRENARLREEREILKKAVTFFAKENK
jgi:transposase-like protein